MQNYFLFIALSFDYRFLETLKDSKAQEMVQALKENSDLFYTDKDALKAKLRIETSDISKEKITELLKRKSVNESTIRSFIEVFNSCDMARYSLNGKIRK